MQDILKGSQVHVGYFSTNAFLIRDILRVQILQTNYQFYVLKEIERTKLNKAKAKLHFYQMVSASLQQQDQGDRLKVCFCVHLYMISIQS